MIRYLCAWLLLASSLQAATVRWTGAAQDVRQVTTIAVSGTWASGDTATITCNNKSVTVTVGTSTTTSNVADILARAIDAANATEDLLGDESRNFGGEEIPEFAEIDASSNGATLTLTSETPGVPFTVTRSEATAGDGALGAVTEATAATGKNWLSNAANYSGGAVPVDNDTLIFESGSADVFYALDHFRTNNIDLNVTITNGWSGQMGLPPVNANGYAEYRNRYLQFRGGGKELRIEPGTGGTDVGRLWIDLQDQTSVQIRITGNRGQATTEPRIFLAGADAATFTNSLFVLRGAVSVEPDDAPTGSTKYATFAVIEVGVPNGSPADAVVWIGRNARMWKTAAYLQNSGTCYCESYTKSGADTCEATIAGGAFYASPGVDGDFASMQVYAGATLYPTAPLAIDEVELFGGTIDCRQSNGSGSGTLTAVRAYAGSAIHDPSGHWVSTIEAIGCTPADLTLSLPPNRQIDISATATP